LRHPLDVELSQFRPLLPFRFSYHLAEVALPTQRPRVCSATDYALAVVPLFVGRGEELALLEAVCSRVKRDGKPAATLVTGLPGSGKTSLLAALRRRQGASRQLSMAGFETGTQLPLAAAGDLLRGLAKVPGAGAS